MARRIFTLAALRLCFAAPAVAREPLVTLDP